MELHKLTKFVPTNVKYRLSVVLLQFVRSSFVKV